ncbi:MAG: CAP domain-containing protein [Polyangiaceae bacterium]|nr:CAP domain-containing protein [Polyangiaceae bacterium]
MRMCFASGVAFILFLACGGTSPPNGPTADGSSPAVDSGVAGDGSVQQLCVDTINAYRATVGLPPLDRFASNESCVDGEAATDMAKNTAHSAFGTCVVPGAKAWGQNECPGWPLPVDQSLKACLAQMWAEGPGTGTAHGHYMNMTNTAYTKVACGFAISADGKTFWAAQDFQ